MNTTSNTGKNKQPPAPSHPGLTLADNGRLVPTNQVAAYNAELRSIGVTQPAAAASAAHGGQKPPLPTSLVEPKGKLQTWLLDQSSPAQIRKQRNAQLGSTHATSMIGAPSTMVKAAQVTTKSVLSMSTALATPTGTITGTVTDASTSAGLVGVTVNAYQGGSNAAPITTTTGTGGTYSLTVPAGVYYFVDFEDHVASHIVQWYNDKPDQASANGIYVTASQTVSNINAALVQGGSVGGTITNSSAQPLAGICVSVYNAANDQFLNAGACSDGSGHYQTTGVPAGSYVLYYSDQASQYVSQWWKSEAGELEANPVTVSTGNTTAVSPVMSLGGSITGTITDAVSHAALTNICAQALGHNGTFSSAPFCSNGSGVYTITGLTSGTYTVEFFDGGQTGYLSQYYSNAPSPTESTGVAVTQGSPTQAIDASMQMGGTITGTVTDAASGTPIQGICVDAFAVSYPSNSDTSQACTNSSGVYTIHGVEGGYSYSVQFSDNSGQGYLPYQLPNPLAITNSTSTTQNAALTLGGTITGTITNSSGTPLSGICVEPQPYLYMNEPTACTNSSGAFSLNGVPAGNTALSIYDPLGNYLAPSSPPVVSVSDGASTSAGTIKLALGGTITGTVTDSSTNAPLANICVDAYSSAGAGSFGCTDSSGNYTLNGLPTGSYSLSTRDESSQYLPKLTSNVSVTAGTTTSGQNFALLKGGSISGTVTDLATGQPLFDVCVSAAQGSVTYGSTCADWSGHFSIGALATGSYSLTAVDNSGFYLPWTGTSQVSVTQGSTTSGQNVGMQRGGTITGTVTDAASSAPLGGVCVSTPSASPGPLSCSDATGAYAIVGLPTGSYDLNFNDVGGTYLPQWYNGQSSQANATAVSVTQGTTVTGKNAAMQVGASLAGTVTDASTSAPIASQCVSVYPTGSTNQVATACTDSSGNYVVSGLPTGTYNVDFQGGGAYVGQWYANQPTQGSSTSVSLTAGSAKTGINAALVQGGKISGTITDASTTKPVAGACVSAYDSAGDSGYACSAQDGTYTIEGLPASTSYTVYFNASGYLGQWYNGQSSPANASKVTVSLGQTTGSVSAALVLGGTITGKVTDLSGSPLTNVNVSVWQGNAEVSSASTGFGGLYSINGLPAGANYTVEFQDYFGGYLTQWYNGKTSQASADPVNVSLGATTSGISAAMSQGGTISGEVIDASTGAPLAGICVNVFVPSDLIDTVSSACTDSTGNYKVTGLQTSSYAVEFLDSTTAGYLTQWYNNQPSGSSANLVSVTLNQNTPNINASMVLGGKISGQVTDAKTGLPAPGVCAQAEDSSSGAYIGNSGCSDSNGDYTISGLPAGSYDVYFYGNSTLVAQNDTNAVTVKLGQTTPGVNFALQEGGTITGHVYDNSGTPLAGCSVLAFPSGSTSSEGSACAGFNSADPGGYTIEANSGGALPPGNYQVEFDLSGYSVQWYNAQTSQAAATTVAVTAGSATPGIDGHLAPGGTVSGTVTDASTGQPLTNICVYLETTDGSFVNSTCSEDSSGGYSLTAASGTYIVQFQGGSYISQYYNGTSSGSSTSAGATQLAVSSSSSPSGIDAAMQPGGTISGKVTDSSSGAALPNVCVNVYDASSGAEVSSYNCTDSSGNYTTAGLPSGSYKVEFTDYQGRYLSQFYGSTNDNIASGTPVSVTLGQNTPNISIGLTLGGAITGKVTDSATGNGVGDICITLWPTSSGSSLSEGCTGPDGTYTTYNVPAGSYDVEFSDPAGNYATQWWQNSTTQAGATAVNVTAGGTASGINASLQSIVATLTGTVTDSVTGHPVPGACVYLYQSGNSSFASYATCADPNGVYYLSGIQQGQYDVAYFDPSGAHITQWYPAASSQSGATAQTFAQGQTYTINESLPEVTGIVGKVTDSVTGAAIAGVCVYLYTTAGARATSVPGTCTDGSGNYALAAPAGSYVVGFLDNSGAHVTDWSGNQSSENSATTVTVTAGSEQTVNASMAEVTGVSGVVTDSVTGAPLANICVYPYTTGGTRTADTGTCTNADGSYILPLSAGSYDLAFFDPAGSYQTQWSGGSTTQGGATAVTVVSGQTASSSPQMNQLATITGAVTQSTAGNAAYPGVCVYLDDYPSGAFSGYGNCTQSNGVFTITGVAPGSYTVGYYTPSQPQGPGAPPTGYWYNGASSEATATPVQVSPGTTNMLATQSLP